MIVSKQTLGFHWPTQDPFLFLAHHEDFYPAGDEKLGPIEPLIGRKIGEDFDLSNNWKMYHGRHVPGFPMHPHRGFETITIVLDGFIDHFDSAGGSGRYGQGDIQWMTAGAGLQHSEMFPLIYPNRENYLHLFQLWINLPSKDKFVKPDYKMIWSEQVPIVKVEAQTGTSEVKIISGNYAGILGPEPSEFSWAANRDHGVNILIIKLEANHSLDFSASSDTLNRTLYFYKGEHAVIENYEEEGLSHSQIEGNSMYILKSIPFKLRNETLAPLYFLLLEAEPINEPVAQYGPFVMTTRDEIQQAYADYQKTAFGGWPWTERDPVHKRDQGRIAIYPDGQVSKPPE
jgi:redox-sensitive bicupin YhaK (pirin superfamily)